MTSQLSPHLVGHREVRPSPLGIDISCPDEDTVVVTPRGEADIYSVDLLQQAVLNAIREGRPHVIVDLDYLTFMDASTLGILVGAHRRTAAEGRSLRVRCHPRHNRRLLTMTGLGGMLDPNG